MAGQCHVPWRVGTASVVRWTVIVLEFLGVRGNVSEHHGNDGPWADHGCPERLALGEDLEGAPQVVEIGCPDSGRQDCL